MVSMAVGTIPFGHWFMADRGIFQLPLYHRVASDAVFARSRFPVDHLFGLICAVGIVTLHALIIGHGAVSRTPVDEAAVTGDTFRRWLGKDRMGIVTVLTISRFQSAVEIPAVRFAGVTSVTASVSKVLKETFPVRRMGIVALNAADAHLNAAMFSFFLFVVALKTQFGNGDKELINVLPRMGAVAFDAVLFSRWMENRFRQHVIVAFGA